MNYKVYTTSFKAWDAMLEAIGQAQKSIFLEMYIFLDDTVESHDFIGKLEQKARDGLRVIVVSDAYGSKLMKKETAEAMKESGIELMFFSHWLRHIHRKILIVDERIAFIGGVNIGKRFANWRDLQLRFEGRIVKKILRSFAYTYAMTGGKNQKILAYREKKLAYKLRFWIIEHWPTRNIYAMKDHYAEKISAAKKSIRIASPYFTPPRWMISLLDDAKRRGVEIEIMVPKEADIPIMNRVNYHYIDKIHRLGARILLSRSMNHSKLLLIDDSEGLVGSQNVDLASFNVNAEVGIFFKDRALVKELERIFEDWKNDSEQYTPKHYKMHAIDYTILALSKILRPIL